MKKKSPDDATKNILAQAGLSPKKNTFNPQPKQKWLKTSKPQRRPQGR